VFEFDNTFFGATALSQCIPWHEDFRSSPPCPAAGLRGEMTFLGVDVDTANANKPAFDTTIAGIAGVDETSIVALSFAPSSSYSSEGVTQCFLDGGDCASCCPDCDDLSYSRNGKDNVAADNCVCYKEVLDDYSYDHFFDYMGVTLSDHDDCLHVSAPRVKEGWTFGVYGGSGDDVIVLEGNEFSDIYGGSGEDKITIIGNDADNVDGGDDNDNITIIGDRAGGRFGINGGYGDDTIIIVGDSSDSVVGGPDHDSCSILGKGPVTCANTDCVDLDTQCGGWAAEGGCDTNPGWMLPNCKKSCDACPTDAGGYDCNNGYGSPGYCGQYDQPDFISSEMCCACGGGAEEMQEVPADCEGETNVDIGVKALYDIKVEDDDEANEISGRITSADPAAVSVEGLDSVTCLSIDAPANYATFA
jgi:hypothetical protein